MATTWLLLPLRIADPKINEGVALGAIIRITHEMPILPGIISARILQQEYHGYRASLVVTGPNLISVSINDGELKEHALRKYVVF